MKKSFKALLTSVLCIGSIGMANAAYMTINNPNAAETHQFTVDFGTIDLEFSSPVNVDSITVMDKDKGGQSYDNVGNNIETFFGLNADTFQTESELSGVYTQYKGDLLSSTSTASISSDVEFDYLSIHLGGYSTFIKFTSLMPTDSEFIFQVLNATKGGGLSNYRVYNSNELSAVPIPSAAFLCVPAIIGFMALRKRKLNQGF